ncbi:hypothetical protein [Marinagarivorans cellulosilyticus]|uniref:Uncharacterized protein n=1 Tax=Marinagarivorans cellulosilyticus TaxID=2721545 RepID=A0AAN1WE84_9GAMM|nr:hypothetical protein [Marinagarivorans cellulosilyticus]BCD95976.1 hypothetical protein MARGE09_P0175 [Marinagarivorans cellulosilyticus]
MADYSFALLFNKKNKKKVVTNVDFQVTNLTEKKTLAPDTMPDILDPGDTLKFVVDNSTEIDKLNSCLFTSYPVHGSPGESPFAPPYDRASIDFIGENLFGQPLEVAKKRKGSWIFHMMGLYRNNGKHAAYYLDPEATCG